VFEVQGVSQVWMLVLDVAWLNIPSEPKFYFEFIRQLSDVAIDHAGGSVVSASGDINAQRVAIFYSSRDAAKEFEDNWRTVARKVRADIAAWQYPFTDTDIPF